MGYFTTNFAGVENLQFVSLIKAKERNIVHTWLYLALQYYSKMSSEQKLFLRNLNCFLKEMHKIKAAIHLQLGRDRRLHAFHIS